MVAGAHQGYPIAPWIVYAVVFPPTDAMMFLHLVLLVVPPGQYLSRPFLAALLVSGRWFPNRFSSISYRLKWVRT